MFDHIDIRWRHLTGSRVCNLFQILQHCIADHIDFGSTTGGATRLKVNENSKALRVGGVNVRTCWSIESLSYICADDRPGAAALPCQFTSKISCDITSFHQPFILGLKPRPFTSYANWARHWPYEPEGTFQSLYMCECWNEKHPPATFLMKSADWTTSTSNGSVMSLKHLVHLFCPEVIRFQTISICLQWRLKVRKCWQYLNTELLKIPLRSRWRCRGEKSLGWD